MDLPIGTCSLCGGPVVTSSYAVDATPYCKHCGATARHPHGPKIDMVPNAEHPDWYPAYRRWPDGSPT